MQLRTVRQIAEKAGVGLRGVKIRIVRDADLVGRGIFGHASPKGTITLYPDAFRNTEALVRTLGHERTHLMQFKIFGQARDVAEGVLNERAAFGIEDAFWMFFRGRQ